MRTGYILHRMHTEPLPTHYRAHFVIIFLLVSFNLRMAFSAADPLLVFLMRDLGLSISDGGLFGLLPIMSLGIAAPLGAWCSRLISPRKLIIYALLGSLVGVVWRSYGGILGLFGGTVIIGLGLGMAGSVILGVVKQVLPDKLPELMGAYTACISLGTAVGAGSSAPLALALGGWQHGLVFWGLPLLFAAVLWTELTLQTRHTTFPHRTVKAPMAPLFRQPRARMITLFYLFRVAGAWLLIVWMATLMRERGLPLVEAGLVLSLSTACQIPGSLLCGMLLRQRSNMRKLMFGGVFLSIVACWGLLEAPLQLWIVFALLLGLGLGTVFSIGMTLITESGADESATIALSGMAQGIGFTCGGALAWLCGLCMELPHRDLWFATTYTALALLGLLCGWRCLPRDGAQSTSLH